MHVIAAKAVCFQEALPPEFRAYQKQIVLNARVLADALAGHGFRIVSGGTDTHLMLVDVFSNKVTGKQAEKALGNAGITVNKNAIPFDVNPPIVQRHPHRHARRHHAPPKGAADGVHRRLDHQEVMRNVMKMFSLTKRIQRPFIALASR